MLSEIDRSVPVIFLDTGFHFPETLAFKTQFAERYQLNLIEMHPLNDPGPLYATDPDRCCNIRKVEPMRRALQGYDAWMTALRRDQSETRSALEVAEWHDSDDGRKLKVYPLLTWTQQDVWRYLYEHDVPYHPLLDQGYTSIGCWPCTRRTAAGEDERAGRWSGTGKTECGLHTFTKRIDP
jgi:phosphoadenosine phosphosulfate reductase